MCGKEGLPLVHGFHDPPQRTESKLNLSKSEIKNMGKQSF
jgi:hypothetical protein